MSPGALRIGTWNLDHARALTRETGRSADRDEDRVALIDRFDCDVVVLTETHDRIRPLRSDFTAVHSDPRPYCPNGERWTTIWTRLPVMRRLRTVDPLRTVAAVVEHECGPVLVFGNVLPWHADVGDGRMEPSPRHWEEHRRVVAEQTAEWISLAEQNPDARMVIAGDWNTDLLAGSGLATYTYGLVAETDLLLSTAADLGLDVATRHRADPGPERPWLIDHIAAGPRLTKVETAPAVSREGNRLSDQPFVCIEVG